jgi:lantibiotic modifying enzyme
MLISKEEFTRTVRATTSLDDFQEISANDCRGIFSIPKHSPIQRWATEFQKMLRGLAEIEFSAQQTSPLQKLSEAGSEYGLQALGKTVSSELIALLKPRAMRHIKHNLRQILSRVTRPCYALEFNAFRCAYGAVFSQNASPSRELLENKFLGDRPCNRLISLFKKFPVLAELWSQLICQWCESVSELLARVDTDKQALARVFFRGEPVGQIMDLCAGLSDPHNQGRTVMRIQFQSGSIMYKPRWGHGEQEWFSLISYLNRTWHRPKLTGGRVLRRDRYCWMEEISFATCKDEGAVGRFYKRLGGIIAAAYLLKAVDCHRDNLIASGEHPVLIDAETLWHVADERKTKSVLDSLYATGFLPRSGRRSSYQYRSSALGLTACGKHIPYLSAQPLNARHYEKEIISGFRSVWRCLIGTTARRRAFLHRLHRIRRREWRRIYRSTAKYDSIIRASIHPAAMRSRVDRDLLIAELCRRTNNAHSVIRAEITALRRLDVPYLVWRSTEAVSVPEEKAAPLEVIDALRRAMHL